MPAHVKSPGRAAMRLATVSRQSSTGAVEGWGRNSASHWASLSRVAVAHCVRDLVREGLLAKRGRALLLPDPEALRAQLEEDASARPQ